MKYVQEVRQPARDYRSNLLTTSTLSTVKYPYLSKRENLLAVTSVRSGKFCKRFKIDRPREGGQDITFLPPAV
jgi:hypothetical protein